MFIHYLTLSTLLFNTSKQKIRIFKYLLSQLPTFFLLINYPLYITIYGGGGPFNEFL